jgi:hypothetical protein
MNKKQREYAIVDVNNRQSIPLPIAIGSNVHPVEFVSDEAVIFANVNKRIMYVWSFLTGDVKQWPLLPQDVDLQKLGQVLLLGNYHRQSGIFELRDFVYVQTPQPKIQSPLVPIQLYDIRTGKLISSQCLIDAFTIFCFLGKNGQTLYCFNQIDPNAPNPKKPDQLNFKMTEFEIATGKILKTVMIENQSERNSIVMNEDGTALAIVRPNSFSVYSTTTWEKLDEQQTSTDSYIGLHFSAAGKLYLAHENGQIIIFTTKKK